MKYEELSDYASITGVFTDQCFDSIKTIADLGSFESVEVAMAWSFAAAKGLLIRERDGWVTVFHKDGKCEGVVFTRNTARQNERFDDLAKLNIPAVT